MNNIFQYDYVQDHEKSKAKNRFDVTDTPVYSQIKDHDKQTNDVSLFLLFQLRNILNRNYKNYSLNTKRTLRIIGVK